MVVAFYLQLNGKHLWVEIFLVSVDGSKIIQALEKYMDGVRAEVDSVVIVYSTAVSRLSASCQKVMDWLYMFHSNFIVLF